MENEQKVTAANEFYVVLAEEKMLKEMSDEHSMYQDAFHNWLCSQLATDSVLVFGILKEDRTISGAETYVFNKAKEQATTIPGGKGAMVADDVVFGWVRDYFVMEKLPVQDKKDSDTYNSKKIAEHMKKSKDSVHDYQLKKLEEEPRYKDYLVELKGKVSEEVYRATLEDLLSNKSATKDKSKSKEVQEISLFDEL